MDDVVFNCERQVVGTSHERFLLSGCFNEDIISGLIYDAFNPSYSEKGIVDVAQFDMVLEVMDTPQQVKFQVSGDDVLDEMEANQSESEEEEEY